MFGTVFIFFFGIALPLARKFHARTNTETIFWESCLVIVAHATARTPTLQNKGENTAESLSLQVTPMGLVLGWLGAKGNEQKATPSPKRSK